ncbi:MAG TPA: preprotein translocase subunit SecA, partial [Bacteroidales bacterium]|nr:preprotein translocase subunit SecA [Bacteroidales bacterium]
MPTKHERDMKALWPIVNTINEAYNKIEKLSNDELRNKTLEFRKLISDTIESEERELNELKTRIDEELDMSIDQKEKIFHQIDDLEKIIYQKTQKVLNDILPEAFAVVKETTKRFKDNPEIVVTATDFDRELATKKNYVKIEGDKAIWQNHWIAGGTEITWDMVPYDVQLMGGVVLHQGKISEMATGEGKTLVATLPVYLNALPGRGVHIVTVNDYLAKRDQEWMGPIYEFLFLTVDCIDKHEPNSESRKKAYLADITYGTNNEFGFDYLRDNMAFSLDEIVQRGHYYAIVDEVDSILIDDARTPLIISGPTTQVREQEYDELKPYVIKLVNAQRQLVNKLLNDAKNYLQKPNRSNEDEKLGGEALLRAHRGLPKYGPLIKFLSEPGMKSILYKTENNYLAENQKNMPIIDAELYFVIDERNNSVDLTDKGTELLAKDTGDSKFFIIPDIGSELAELENSNIDPKEKQEKKNELLEDFAIKSDRIHTMHQLLRAYTLFDKDVEYVVLNNKVKIVDEQTGRILEGRRYSDGLHEAIEAKENVKVEAATQTYATITLQNYFRMYKKLAGMTGTAETEAAEFWDIYKLDVVVIPTNKPCIRVDAEDLVYRTKREKYNAVINEVVNLVQKGRPVLIGTTSVETSELLSKMLTLRKIKHNVLNAKQHQREAEIVAKAGLSGSVTIATNMAGRGTDIKLGPGVREVGGLAIIGTERHESRRVDRQLRGR